MGDDKDAWVSQMRKGAADLGILALLARNEMYGSQIVESLSGHAALAISAGTAYPLLARLKKAGLISSQWRESPVGPPRKYYALTARGRDELQRRGDAWNEFSGGIDQILKEARNG